MKKFNLTISKKGITCLWEEGGGMTKTGCASVIAGRNGEPKCAIYVRTHGDLSNGNHALIPVEPGDYVVEAGYGHGKDYFTVDRIVKINKDEATAEYEEVTEIPRCLLNAIDAAIQKSNDNHCRTPYYIYQ